MKATVTLSKGAMTVRDALQAFIAQTSVTQSSVAHELGVSPATVSLFLKGTYTGDNDELASKVNQYINMGTVRMEVAKAPGIALEVGNTGNILHIAKMAHLYGKIALLFGPAGCSKTTSLQHYANTTNGVIYVQADTTTSRPRKILQAILASMGEGIKGSNTDYMTTIVNKLVGTKHLLIIDEAQHLTEKSLDTIRALNDKAGIGIVYAGNPLILKRMYGRQEDEYDQLFSRITYKVALGNQYTKEDIRHIFAGRQLSAKCLDYLHTASWRKGGLRLMMSQYEIAQNMANSDSQPLAVSHLEKAAVMMGIARMAE